MLRSLLRAKIHRARVTEADLNYEGSITIDEDLLDASTISVFEKVDVVNVTNGNRFTTYVIPGVRGSGKICVNGAAARLVHKDDLVIIICYGDYSEKEIENHKATLVFVDEQNRVTESVTKSISEMAPI